MLGNLPRRHRRIHIPPRVVRETRDLVINLRPYWGRNPLNLPFPSLNFPASMIPFIDIDSCNSHQSLITLSLRSQLKCSQFHSNFAMESLFTIVWEHGFGFVVVIMITPSFGMNLLWSNKNCLPIKIVVWTHLFYSTLWLRLVGQSLKSTCRPARTSPASVYCYCVYPVAWRLRSARPRFPPGPPSVWLSQCPPPHRAISMPQPANGYSVVTS